MRIDETVGGSRLRARSVSASRSETLLGASILYPDSRTLAHMRQDHAEKRG